MGVAPGTVWNGFGLLDELRRNMGEAFDRVGWGPVETPSQVVFSEPGVRLKSYGGIGPSLLLIPAPIKRSYIWDLSPGRSVVARALASGCRVFVLTWQEPDGDGNGLADYADRMIGACRAEIEARTGQRRMFLAGHSLGGTLAAISACLDSEDVQGLILLGAPLDFASGADMLAPLVAALPLSFLPPGRVPGSFLNAAATAVAPLSFGCVPWLDRMFGALDAHNRETLRRVERWALDELPMPNALLADVVQRLYRENAFVRGNLMLGERRVAVEEFAAPVLSIVAPHCPFVPPQAVEPFYGAIRSTETRLLRYDGDSGVLLQHVGMLVGELAHRRLWPEILRWVHKLAGESSGAAGRGVRRAK